MSNMSREERQHYFQQRPVLSAFVVMPGVAVGAVLSSLVVLWLKPPTVLGIVITVMGLAVGFAMSRFQLDRLMGQD